MAEIIKFGKEAPQPAPEVEEADDAPVTCEDLPLQQPGYGETEIGTLTDEEAEIFVRAFLAQGEYEALQRRLNGLATVGVGNLMITGDMKTLTDPEEAKKHFEKVVNPAEMKELFRLGSEIMKDRGEFFWRIGERLNVHDFVIGVRTKRRIVRCSRKW